MTSKLEAGLRTRRWEASKRPQRSGQIDPGPPERALELHIVGRYEEAIAEIECIPKSDRTAGAWRVLGHAEHGRGNFNAAIAAHQRALDLHAQDASAAADDEVNIAAVHISAKNYGSAWEAAERARRLSPESLMPWTPKISILNRQGRHDELRLVLQELLAEKPDILANPVFLDHLSNDTDFIGVEDIMRDLIHYNNVENA